MSAYTPFVPHVPFSPPPDPTELRSGNYTKTGIINRIYNLIGGMVTVLQDAASAQAQRLQFYSQWQADYTNVMAQVHTFLQGDGSGLGTGSATDPNSESEHARQDLNRLNANYVQSLQNRQSVVGDGAKSLQSNVNQSNDAVNQQSNLATALIQELNTLLGAIYR